MNMMMVIMMSDSVRTSSQPNLFSETRFQNKKTHALGYRTCLIDPDSPALSGNQTWQRRIPFGNRTRVHKWMHMDLHGGLSREPISVSAYHKYATVKIHEIRLTPGAARLLNSVDLRTHLTPVRVIIHTNNCRHLNDLLNVGILMHILAVWYEMVRRGG